MPLPIFGKLVPSGKIMSIALGFCDGSSLIVTSCFVSLTWVVYLSPFTVSVVPWIFVSGTGWPFTSRAAITHSPWSFSRSFFASSAGSAARKKNGTNRSARFMAKPREILTLQAEQPQQPGQRVVVFVDHAFLQRNDRVVGNRDAFGTDLRAALGDVAVADAIC